MAKRSTRGFAIALISAAALISVSCRPTHDQAPIHPLILFAVDGADWEVIEWLWQQDRLPYLKQLADRGLTGSLETFHHASPVIWTTVATGRMPDVHGITEFVVPTGKGDQPVSSTLRRVPALWNMVTASGGKVAVIGWWASWPVENVDGIMISDRAVHDIPDRVWPPGYEPVFDAELAHLREQEDGVKPESMLEQDRIFARVGAEIAGQQHDLVMLYLRGVDISCHFHWRAFEPEAFPDLDAGDLATERELIAREYELVDQTLGTLMSNAGSNVNVVVMSDHGFDAMDGETTHIRLNFDAVLENLGFMTRTSEGVDFTRSKLYSYDSPERSLVKKVRFALAGREEGGRVVDTDRAAIRDRLEAALESVTFRGGSPAFTVRDATAKETQQGADLIVEVLTEGARKPLKVDGVPLRGAIRSIDRLSGTHGRKTPGIFIVAGPDIETEVNLENPRVIDIPPTVLHAIGLPVAEDFAGRAMTEIFTASFLASHPLRTIPTWGEPVEGANRASEVDDELVDQLRALGYIE